MSKLGKLLLIFGIIALISAVAFGVSVAAFGAADGNYGISFWGGNIPFLRFGGKPEVQFRNGDTVYTFDFESGRTYDQTFDAAALTDISIEVASAHSVITCSETDKAYVKYTAGDMSMRFTAEMKNGKFSVLEHSTGFFSFGSFRPAELEIRLPEKLYNDVAVAVASGSFSADGLTSDKMEVSLASGSLDMNVYARTLTYSAASGEGKLTNCTDKTSDKLKISTASGSQTLNGFRPASTKVDIASGRVTMSDVSGSIDVNIASGKVELDYAEWNGDLDIDLMSGKADRTLPAGSGIDLDFDRASGGMDISLDGDSVSLSKDAGGSYGGSNIHKAEIDVASGHVSIHN